MAIISQRPAELDSTILSQCSTVFSLRLSNEFDQEIIRKARDRVPLSEPEIRFFVEGLRDERLSEGQVAAFAMAVFFNGLSRPECVALTRAMMESGDVLDWSDAGLPGPSLDKHSTGGVGDKVSIPLAPLLACCGLQVPMLSGRGLGATGGTLDKLEAIPGFRTDLSLSEITTLTQKVGCVITGASAELAPADRRLYGLRDVTATVPSIPLITASIMSKKLAEGLDALVLDVKVGSGAFMKTLGEGRELARLLVETGRRMGVATTALITDMSQPLGRMAGNALEVDETVRALSGEGPNDLVSLTCSLGAELLLAAGMVASNDEALALLQRHIDTGAGRRK